VPPVEPSRGSARALVRPRRIRLCSVALVLLGALIFATGAHASELAVEPPTVEAELPTSEAPAPAGESPAPEAPAPEEPVESPTTEAPAPEALPESPAPEAPVVSPPEVQPPEVQLEPPASEAIVESTTEPASEKPVAEHPQEPVSAASQGEATVVARSSEASSTKGTQSAAGVGSGTPGPPSGGLVVGAPIDPVVPATGAPAEGTADPLTAAAARAASARVAARKSAAFGAGPLDCARALERPGEACSGWVVAPQQLSESSVLPLGAPGGPLPPGPRGATTGASGGHSVVSAPSGNSTPGPSPGGSSGGASAGGGGGGFAPSGALTLAGLLLLAAPRAMRLLRLLCRPWRGTCFALIPERPG
jgi:hypothetical protein